MLHRGGSTLAKHTAHLLVSSLGMSARAFQQRSSFDLVVVDLPSPNSACSLKLTRSSRTRDSAVQRAAPQASRAKAQVCRGTVEGTYSSVHGASAARCVVSVLEKLWAAAAAALGVVCACTLNCPSLSQPVTLRIAKRTPAECPAPPVARALEACSKAQG